MASPDMLWQATLASSTAVALTLALRKPLRDAFGARVAYAAWGLVPVALLAVGLPAPTAGRVAGYAIDLPTAMPAAWTAAFDGGAPSAAALLVAWCVGMCATAAWMGAQQLRFRRNLGVLADREDGTCEAEHATPGLPATLGWPAPRVVVPPGFDAGFAPGQRELMLAHERAHLARGDVHANALAAAIRCLFWFNPLLHFAAASFRQDQELACDACVLSQQPSSRRAYAEALLQAQLCTQATPLGCHFGFGHPLKERIAMLREPLPSNSRRIAGTALVIVLAIGSGAAAWAAQPPGNATDPRFDREVSGTTLPPPKYPEYAAEHHLSGNLVMIVDVAADGSVANAIVERSEPEGVFDEMALAAVKQWRFTPAMKDGTPIAGRVRVPIEFRPDN